MGATRLLVRSTMRDRWRSTGLLALVTAVGLGAALIAFTTAWRTEHAYGEYLERADVSDLVVNTGLVTDHLVEQLRSIPGVERLTTTRFLTIGDEVGGIAPDAAAEASSFAVQPLGSADGRYVDVDRPTIVRGRMIEAADEVVLNQGAADLFHLDLDAELTVPFTQAVPTSEDDAPPVQVGEERVRVVGIARFADEVLGDELYPQMRMLFSPQVTARYACVGADDALRTASRIDEATQVILPTGCATDATFFALRISGGDAEVAAVQDEVQRRVAAENDRLPAAVRESDFGFLALPAVTAVEVRRVARSVAPVVLVLRLVGWAAFVAWAAIAGVIVTRSIARGRPATRTWFELGATRSSRTAAIAAPELVGAALGCTVALVTGWLGSVVGPSASVGVLDRSGRRFVWDAIAVSWTSATIGIATFIVIVAWTGVISARRAVTPERPNRAVELAGRLGNVPFALGVRGARGVRVAGAAAIAVAVATGGLVYASSLDTLVTSPDRSGWSFDVMAAINLGFQGVQPDAVAATLDGRQDVERWGVAAALPTTVDDVAVPGIADVVGLVDLTVPLVRGALPRGGDEVALGATTAHRLGVDVGDRVAVGTDYDQRDATVSGIVVLPSMGALLADRAELGLGVLLPAERLADDLAHAEQARGLAPGTIAATIGGFVAIDLRPGASAAAFVDEVEPDVIGWDRFRFPPIVYADTVRPTQIAQLASTRSSPAVLAVLATLTCLVGAGALALWSSRARRAENAVLRALGARTRQLVATQCWQMALVGFVGVAVGVPLGVIIASRFWRGFAGDIGTLTTPTVPWLVVVLGSAALVVLGVLITVVPARAATRREVAADLRVAND